MTDRPLDPDDLVTVRRGDLEALLAGMGPGRSAWRSRLAAATEAPALAPVIRCVDGCGTPLPGTGGAHARARTAGWSRIYEGAGGRTGYRCPACQQTRHPDAWRSRRR